MNDVEERLNRALHAQADAFEHASRQRDVLGDVRPLNSATSLHRRPIAAAASALATAAAVLAVTVAMGAANDHGAGGGPTGTVASTSAAASTPPGAHDKRDGVVSGIVTTPSGRPVGGVTVVATFAHTAVTAETTPDGRFTLRGLPHSAIFMPGGGSVKVSAGRGQDPRAFADSIVDLRLSPSPKTTGLMWMWWPGSGHPKVVVTHR